MPYAPPLSDTQIEEALQRLAGWQRDGATISRTLRCPSFPAAIALVDRVAEAAEAADHHPEILIRWRRVTFTLTTHAAGGLTHRDMDLAAAIDALAAEGGAESGR
jgi:4a-hydroxytetrahydrobiopterin dehydratase